MATKPLVSITDICCTSMKILVALFAVTSLYAQNIVSPEVHPDRRVTFRLQAPKASEASVLFDWMPAGSKGEPMTKGSDGIFTATLGPLDPTVYVYWFNVDGLNIADPINPRVKLRARTSASLVEVPSAQASLWQPQDTPHGTVDINWTKSAVLNGETRWFWVYTPPGYEKDRNAKYPVLYLFHGSNDTAGGWVLAGHANFILDNLIAQKKAVPMIVIMPWGHAVPFGSPREIQAKNTSTYEDYLLKEVIPYVESKYRVNADRKTRAIAGLSMGGGQSLTIGFRHPELFSSVGAFSAAVPENMDTLLGEAKTINDKYKNIYFACGKQDSLFGRAQKLDELMTSKQIKHTFHPTEGAHNYAVWRQYLGEFAPLLFH